MKSRHRARGWEEGQQWGGVRQGMEGKSGGEEGREELG